MAKEEKSTSSPLVDASSMPMVSTSTRSSIPIGDRWFSQLPVVAARSQFNSLILNRHLWVRHVQVILIPRNLLDHLTGTASAKIDPQYKRWVVEEEALYTPNTRFNDC